MKDTSRTKDWRTLCDAANEQDPKVLMKLIDEINRQLEKKEQRLQGKLADGQSAV